MIKQHQATSEPSWTDVVSVKVGIAQNDHNPLVCMWNSCKLEGSEIGDYPFAITLCMANSAASRVLSPLKQNCECANISCMIFSRSLLLVGGLVDFNTSIKEITRHHTVTSLISGDSPECPTTSMLNRVPVPSNASMIMHAAWELGQPPHKQVNKPPLCV
jgi:hypothetical protein